MSILNIVFVVAGFCSAIVIIIGWRMAEAPTWHQCYDCGKWISELGDESATGPIAAPIGPRCLCAFCAVARVQREREIMANPQTATR